MLPSAKLKNRSTEVEFGLFLKYFRYCARQLHMERNNVKITKKKYNMISVDNVSRIKSFGAA